MKRKSVILLTSFFLCFVLICGCADAATLTIGGSQSVSINITSYTAPGQTAPATESAILQGVSTTGFTNGFTMSFVTGGWTIGGQSTFSSSSDITGRNLAISGPSGTGTTTMILRARSDDATSADATVNLNFTRFEASFDISPDIVKAVQGVHTDQTLNIRTIPAGASFTSLLISDGTAPTDTVKWNNLTVTANRAAKTINVTGIPDRSADKSIQVLASGDWGSITRSFDISVAGGKVDQFLSQVLIADHKADCTAWANPKTCTAHRLRDYTDYGAYTNFNVGGSYYIAFLSPERMPDLIVTLKEPGDAGFRTLLKLEGKPPVITGRASSAAGSSVLNTDGLKTDWRGAAEGYYITSLGISSQDQYPAIITSASPSSTGDYTYRIIYTSNNFRDHVQDIVLRCTPSVNPDSGSGCDAGLGLLAIGATALGALLYVRRKR